MQSLAEEACRKQLSFLVIQAFLRGSSTSAFAGSLEISETVFNFVNWYVVRMVSGWKLFQAAGPHPFGCRGSVAAALLIKKNSRRYV